MTGEICIMCLKKDVTLFNVHTVYDTIKKNFGELYGSQVRGIIDPSDCVCYDCFIVLDKLAKAKRQIWNTICRKIQKGTAQMEKTLQGIDTIKMEAKQKPDDSEQEEYDMVPRSSSPQNSSALLEHTYSESYNKKMEDAIALTQYQKANGDHTRKRKRSKSSLGARSLKRCSSTTSVSSVSSYISTETCDEVADINAWNIRRALSRTPNSVYSSSCVTDSSTVEYDDVGRLVKKRTRSVSRAQEEEKLRLESVEGTIFYCTEKDCDGSFMDLDLYNLHRTIRHRALAMHICYECNKSYTTAEHLRLHSLTHDISSFFCLMCGVEMPNCAELQKHLDEHLAYSVPCKYCDKSFLSKSACAQHCQVKHKKTRYRRLNRCEHLIIDRVDFKPLSTNDNQEDRTYKAYIIEQGSSTRLDVNPENLRMMNIENTEDDLPSGEVEAEYETKEVEENIAQPEELAEEISQELVEEGVIQEEEIVENGISEESFSELLSSSEMLEDVRENCD